MLRFGIQSLAKMALLVIGALIVFDWLSTEDKTDDDNGEAEDAKAKVDEAASEPDDGKDVEGDAVVED
jgi:hypothetical protein